MGHKGSRDLLTGHGEPHLASQWQAGWRVLPMCDMDWEEGDSVFVSEHHDIVLTSGAMISSLLLRT